MSDDGGSEANDRDEDGRGAGDSEGGGRGAGDGDGDGRDAGEGGVGHGPDDHDRDDAGTGGRFAPDPERVTFLREIAEDVRGESSESEQLAALLYRVSDLYDPGEETSPEEIYRNVRNIQRIKERGGLRRENG